uniref:arfaptin-2-like isoform X2 n=1 Tax=Ciona intestinalis TaxID=7719 RepID=UPI0002B8CF4C|nr:arfaptin-2-like isoform X2 [Ciona intestinalis]|eukprot:XP_002127077.2 arfaptin-2-like isoform X2 [Ciona intestinalis]
MPSAILNESGQIRCGQTFVVGSSSVGSRLAGDDPVGSRLASAGVTVNTQSTQDKNKSPVYNPHAPLGLSRSASKSMGFGNTMDTANTTSRISNLTFQDVQQAAAVKAETIKTWSVKTYKCTKQILSEKLGRGTKTVDLELEAKIEILRDTKRKYENLLALARALATHFSNIIQTQKVLGEAFAELSAKSQELQEEFRYNSETQHVLSKNGENLLAAVNFFISGVTTLCSKTMEDSLITVKRYEASRLEFDAYRSELEALNLAPRTEANIMKQAVAQGAFNSHKANYDKLRSDVDVKLQFLDENRVKVMQKQLLLFHNAISAYFAGNQQELESTLKQFNVKGSTPAIASQSWLEKE